MFNLVVTCVGSKNYKGPSVRNTIINLARRGIKDDVKELFNEWTNVLTQNIKSSPFLYEAKEVYKGAMWNASIDAFNEINEDRQLWIMSCGFGFINSKEKISGYHATFKRRENDSLYDSDYFNRLKNIDVTRQWWNVLTGIGIVKTNHPRSIHDLVNNSKPTDTVLIAAGSDYYEAIYDDLNKINVSDKHPNLALVGIKRLNGKYEPHIPKKLEPYVQSYSNGKQLREFLGCSVIQVQSRSASYLIKQYNETGKLKYIFP